MSESDEALEEVTRSIGMLVITIAFLAGFAVGWYLHGETNYRDKVNFCVDRMKNEAIRYVWRKQYCGKVKIEAIDPITVKPVAGIVEGE